MTARKVDQIRTDGGQSQQHADGEDTTLFRGAAAGTHAHEPRAGMALQRGNAACRARTMLAGMQVLCEDFQPALLPADDRDHFTIIGGRGGFRHPLQEDRAGRAGSGTQTTADAAVPVHHRNTPQVDGLHGAAVHAHAAGLAQLGIHGLRRTGRLD